MTGAGGRGAGRRFLDQHRRWLWASIVALIGVILGFLARQLLEVVPDLLHRSVPPPVSYDRRYVLHPVAAYGHIVPGLVFLVGALFQLSPRVRAARPSRHRLLGRLLVPAGLVAGVTAVVVGIWFPYGGATEGVAAAVFGVYVVIALILAWRRIRARDVLAHRRFMIRAFSVGLGVATIRLWLIVFILAGLLHLDTATGTTWFGIAFWLGLCLHALAAEGYLAIRPTGTRAAPARTEAP